MITISPEINFIFVEGCAATSRHCLQTHTYAVHTEYTQKDRANASTVELAGQRTRQARVCCFVQLLRSVWGFICVLATKQIQYSLRCVLSILLHSKIVFCAR